MPPLGSTHTSFPTRLPPHLAPHLPRCPHVHYHPAPHAPPHCPSHYHTLPHFHACACTGSSVHTPGSYLYLNHNFHPHHIRLLPHHTHPEILTHYTPTLWVPHTRWHCIPHHHPTTHTHTPGRFTHLHTFTGPHTFTVLRVLHHVRMDHVTRFLRGTPPLLHGSTHYVAQTAAAWDGPADGQVGYRAVVGGQLTPGRTPPPAPTVWVGWWRGAGPPHPPHTPPHTTRDTHTRYLHYRLPRRATHTAPPLHGHTYTRTPHTTVTTPHTTTVTRLHVYTTSRTRTHTHTHLLLPALHYHLTTGPPGTAASHTTRFVRIYLRALRACAAPLCAPLPHNARLQDTHTHLRTHCLHTHTCTVSTYTACGPHVCPPTGPRLGQADPVGRMTDHHPYSFPYLAATTPTMPPHTSCPGMPHHLTPHLLHTCHLQDMGPHTFPTPPTPHPPPHSLPTTPAPLPRTHAFHHCLPHTHTRHTFHTTTTTHTLHFPGRAGGWRRQTPHRPT